MSIVLCLLQRTDYGRMYTHLSSNSFSCKCRICTFEYCCYPSNEYSTRLDSGVPLLLLISPKPRLCVTRIRSRRNLKLQEKGQKISAKLQVTARRGTHTHTHTPSSTAPVKQNNKPPPVFRRTTGSRHLAVYSLGASRGGCSVEYTFRYPPHENHCGELVDGRLVSPGHDIVPIQRLTVRATCEIRSW